VVGLALAYAARRDLRGRYAAHQQSEDTVRQAGQQVEMLEEQLHQSRQRVEDLSTDPVEMEAAIRRIKRRVREGETVYRVEEAPAPEAQPQP